MIVSVLLMLPFLKWMGANKTESKVVPWSYALLGASLVLLSMGFPLTGMAALIVSYFLGFNLLEAAMPALLARFTNSGGRGRKMGLYSTFQFLGAFAGGAGGGLILGNLGPRVALSAAGGVCLMWALVSGGVFQRLFLTSPSE
jgi:hypothetical protein